MKIIFIVLVFYLVVSVLLSLLKIVFNGSFDQSKEPIIDLIEKSFTWPIGLLKFIFRR